MRFGYRGRRIKAFISNGPKVMKCSPSFFWKQSEYTFNIDRFVYSQKCLPYSFLSSFSVLSTLVFPTPCETFVTCHVNSEPDFYRWLDDSICPNNDGFRHLQTTITPTKSTTRNKEGKKQTNKHAKTKTKQNKPTKQQNLFSFFFFSFSHKNKNTNKKFNQSISCVMVSVPLEQSVRNNYSLNQTEDKGNNSFISVSVLQLT